LERYWLREGWTLAAILGASLLLATLAGHAAAFFILGLLCYLGLNAYKLYRLSNWLFYKNQPEPRFGEDVWGEVYYQIQRRKSRARKRERKLKALIKLYRESAAAMPDATLVLRRDDTIEWMNEAAASLLGLKTEGDIGHPVQNLIRHPEFVRFLESGDYAEPLDLVSPLDESRMMQIHIVPYGDDQRLLVARDITKLHRLEVMRRDFVANVSHELSTPLTVISGYLESLEAKPRGQDVEPVLGHMREQTARMKNLVNDLLQLSRLELNDAQEPETEVEVAAMARSLVTEAGVLAREQSRRHEVELEADDGLLLRGFARDLYSAFANLVRNAVQYTPDGGRIEVRWFEEEDGGACFEVHDSGIGIPAPLVPRLTERFYRVDAGRSRAVGGTGLGLSIVKHVLINHQASLDIDSAPGRGSVFRCRFPAARARRAPARQQAT
jgi:two-component system phosphate regulon sensor histidine kinase PhoR